MDLRGQRELLAGPAEARRHRVRLRRGRGRRPRGLPGRRPRHRCSSSRPQIPEMQADPELSEELVDVSARPSTFYLADEPQPGAIHRPEGARSLRLRLRPRDLLRRGPVGDCVPTLSWIPPGVPGAIETDKFAFDPEAAVQALAESSYGGPENLPEIELYYISDRSGAKPSGRNGSPGSIATSWASSSMLEPTDGTTLIFSLTKDDATHPQLVMFGGWSQDYPDPQNWLSVYWTCDATFAQAVGYCNEEFDRLTAARRHHGRSRGAARVLRAGRRRSCRRPAGSVSLQPGRRLRGQPDVTGYTPTPSESEWPGQFSSLMTIDKTE